MAAKTPVTVALTDPQRAFLAREAARLDITVPDLLRRMIDQIRSNEPVRNVRTAIPKERHP